MPNPKGHEDSIKDSRFKAAWRSGPTRTIRVPIVLADATLEYAHKLDQGFEPRDTEGDIISPEKRVNTIQSHNTRSLIDEVTWLKAENKRLQNLLSDLRIELNDTLKNAPVVLELESPDAADLLNRLKAKHKKSTASLADIEAILEMIEG
jgi:regulator of replication initiation timing